MTPSTFDPFRMRMHHPPEKHREELGAVSLEHPARRQLPHTLAELVRFGALVIGHDPDRQLLGGGNVVGDRRLLRVATWPCDDAGSCDKAGRAGSVTRNVRPTRKANGLVARVIARNLPERGRSPGRECPVQCTQSRDFNNLESWSVSSDAKSGERSVAAGSFLEHAALLRELADCSVPRTNCPGKNARRPGSFCLDASLSETSVYCLVGVAQTGHEGRDRPHQEDFERRLVSQLLLSQRLAPPLVDQMPVAEWRSPPRSPRNRADSHESRCPLREVCGTSSRLPWRGPVCQTCLVAEAAGLWVGVDGAGAFRSRGGGRGASATRVGGGCHKYRPNGGLGDLFFAEPDAKSLSQVLRNSGYTVTEMTADAARREEEPRLLPTAAVSSWMNSIGCSTRHCSARKNPRTSHTRRMRC